MSFGGQNLTVKAGGRAILDAVTIDLAAGEVVAVVGPNGAGKSTMLRALSGEASLAGGAVALNGRKLGAWSMDECALQRAVLPQSPTLAFPFRACDVVELGRYPHRGRASADEHHAAIVGAMEAADVQDLALRDCRTLSGGELHRVHLARALAQVWSPLADGRTRYLLLDEPTSSLDLSHQGLVLSRSKAFAHAGCGVLTILHDLNLAATYADRIVVMDKGRIVAEGAPEAVLTTDLIRTVWHVDARIVPGGAHGPMAVIVHYEGRPAAPAALRAAE
jgi:iron complex transport system ATP-binding protein